MMRLISSQLPLWARPGNPVLRYELGKAQPLERRARVLRALGIVLVGILLLLVGYFAGSREVQPETLDTLPHTQAALAVLFVPALVLQAILHVAAILLTATAVEDEKRRQTWDNLRATESGAAMAFRARWAAVFYRTRGLLGVVLALRVLFIFGMLFDLTAFRGAYLDRLINGITPEVSVIAAVPLLAVFMAATLLLPLTGLGLDAAVGLFCSTLSRQRLYSSVIQILVIMFRLLGVLLLVLGLRQYLLGELPAAAETGAWALMIANAALGDWGFRLMQLGVLSQVWALVPFAIFLGVFLLGAALLQAFLADVVLSLAIRRAERHE